MAREKLGPLEDYSIQKGAGYFFDNEPLPLDFVLPGLMRKSVGVLVAAGSTGKSFYAVQTCLSVCAGRDLFGLYGGAEITAGPVTYLALEDTLDVFWHRLYGIAGHLRQNNNEDDFKAIRKAADQLHIHELYGRGFRPIEGDDLQPSAHLRQSIDAVKAQGARLVIVDTYSRFLAGHSEQDNAVAATIVAALEQMCQETNAAVLVLHHTNKVSQLGGGQGEQGAARGASALTDNARYQMNMWTMPREVAEAHGVPDDERKAYVFAEATKANHLPPQGKTWLQRQRGGVLTGIDPLPEVPQQNGRQGRFQE
ncbi:helicase RepA family protein [Roseovarius sp. EC-SD190]